MDSPGTAKLSLIVESVIDNVPELSIPPPAHREGRRKFGNIVTNRGISDRQHAGVIDPAGAAGVAADYVVGDRYARRNCRSLPR